MMKDWRYFENVASLTFWIIVKSDYPELYEIALNSFTPFPFTYFVKTSISTVGFLETKYRSSFNIDHLLSHSHRSNLD